MFVTIDVGMWTASGYVVLIVGMCVVRTYPLTMHMLYLVGMYKPHFKSV